MSHDNCIFCKIINGEIPAAKVYEDDDVFAFLDISQVTKGHTLVIPKKHTRNIYDTPPEVASALFARIPKIATAIQKAFQADGMNILNNNEAAASQTVFHLHIHLIPKYEGVTGFEFNWETNEADYPQDVLATIAKTIQDEIQ